MRSRSRSVSVAVLPFLGLLSVFLWKSFAQSNVLYGPEDFVQKPGTTTQTRTFAASSLSDRFTFCLTNGGSLGQFGLSSHFNIRLNGEPLISGDVGLEDATAAFSRRVSLQAANKLTIDPPDKPGSGFTIFIIRGSSCGPAANAGAGQIVNLNATVQLDGSASSNPDGIPLTFAWTFLDKPAASKAALTGSTTKTPTFTADAAGAYVVQLTVTEQGGKKTSSDSVTILTAGYVRKNLFGPEDFVAGPDGAITATRTFPATALGARYTLCMDNGGSRRQYARVARVGIELNGESILGEEDDFGERDEAPKIARSVKLKATNRLDIDIHDAKGSGVTVLVLEGSSCDPFANAGPNQTVTTGVKVQLDGTASNDPDGDALTFTWKFTTKPAGSNATLAGATTATPSFVPDAAGNYTIQLSIKESGRNESATATVVVTATLPTKLPPTITSTPVTTAAFFQAYTYPVIATDPYNDPLTYSLISFPLGMTIGSSTGIIQWTPPGTGTLPVTVQVANQHGGAATQSFNINVTAAPNLPPKLKPITGRTISIGVPYQLRLTADDPNPLDTLTFSLVSGPAGAALNPAPLLQWTPTAAQLGANNFTVRVQDNAGAFDQQTFTIQVVNTNQPPKFDPQTDASLNAGNTFTRLLHATDPNPGDTLTYNLISGPAGMTITAGQLSWTPLATQLGVFPVKVQVTDSGGSKDAAMFNITVDVAQASAPQPPIAVDDQFAVRRQSTLTVPAPGVLGNDSSPSGKALIAKLVTGPLKGAFNLAADGSLTYTPIQPAPALNQPMLKFAFKDPTNNVTFTVTQPIVVDLDRDGIPEIVFVAWNTFLQRRLIAVHGDTGAQLFSVDAYQPTAALPIVIDQGVELAAGDLDGDGYPEILAVSSPGVNDPSTSDIRRFLIAFNRDGTVKWRSQDVIDGLNVTSTTGFSKPLIANILGGPHPNIAVGYLALGPAGPMQDYVTVFDYQGRIAWTSRGGGGVSSINPSPGYVLAQDINLDGKLEVLFSDDVFDSQGHHLWNAFQASESIGVRDVAVVNSGVDPYGLVIYLDGFNFLYAVDYTGARRWGPVASVPFTDYLVGTMTIGDPDGDGVSKILVPGHNTIAVVRVDGTPSRTISLLYRPLGGNVAIFDLNGDGKPELIYNSVDGPSGTGIGDLIITDSSGAFLFSAPSARISVGFGEGPVIADVAGDGTASIVTGGSGPDGVLLHVYKAKNGQWSQARPIYNQFSYHITNVNRDGTIPAVESPNWLTPGLDNFRVNLPLPQERGADIDQFTYKASDGILDSNPATVRIDILPPNTTPRILSAPPLTAAPNVLYTYAVRAVGGAPGQVLTFSLTKAPVGMSIVPTTGLIQWTPTASQTGNFLVALKVADPLGEFDSQAFTVTLGPPALVPSLLGLAQAAAQTALAASGLSLGSVTLSPSNTYPAGQVISQQPGGGTAVAAGSTVSVGISTGPLAVAVPNLVGKSRTAALTQLTGLGLSGAVTMVFSATVDQSVVISQNPAPGTFTTGSVSLTVSAGSGLTLRLQRSVTTADVPIPFTAVANDLNLVESSAPPLNYVVTPALTPIAGTLPTVNGSNIVPATTTRGVFRVTATDPVTNHTATADFSVTYPQTPGQYSMMDGYARFTGAMSDIDAILRQARTALAANDAATVRLLAIQMVNRWRQVDMTSLSLGVPLALENGFVPAPADLAQFGLTLTPDDLLIAQVLDDASADLQAWTDALNSSNATMAQLTTLASQFGTRAARLNGLTLSEAGAIYVQGQYAVLLSNRLPQLYNALMNEVGTRVGLAPVHPLGAHRPATFRTESHRVWRDSTLAEVLTTTAMQYLVDTIMDNTLRVYKNAKQFAHDVMGQAAWGVVAIAAAQHIRAAVQGQDLAGVVAGASLSFRQFGAPYSMIEGEVDARNPNSNVVIMIGPDILAPALPFIQSIQNGMSYRKTLGSPGSYKNASSAVSDLVGLAKALINIQNQTQNVVQAVSNAFQNTSLAARPCILSASPTCGELLYPGGLASVYKYTPPQGFSTFSGIPVPIIFMVYSRSTGVVYFDTPPFFPTTN